MSYVLAVFEMYGLDHQVSPEAQAIARRFIAGDEHWADGSDALQEAIWAREDAVRRLPGQKRTVLLGRFGLSSLPNPQQERETRDEALEWLPQLIQEFGYDPTPAYALLHSHFPFV